MNINLFTFEKLVLQGWMQRILIKYEKILRVGTNIEYVGIVQPVYGFNVEILNVPGNFFIRAAGVGIRNNKNNTQPHDNYSLEYAHEWPFITLGRFNDNGPGSACSED